MWNQPAAAAVPSSVSAAGPTSAGTLPAATAYTLQAQAFAAAAENVPRPAVPAVVGISDRQVYVENVEVPPSGYIMARRWMRNEPEVDVESIVGPATSALLLPRPLELSTEGLEEFPPLVDDVDDYDPEQAVVDLKRHWVRQRKHATALRMKRVDRYRDRLKLVAAANTLAVTQLLAAQQHPGAALQQQQLLQLQHLQQQAKQQQGTAVSQAQQQQGAVVLQLPPHALAPMPQMVKQEAGAGADEGAQPMEQQRQQQLGAEGVDPAAAAAAMVEAGGEVTVDAAAAAAAAVDIPAEVLQQQQQQHEEVHPIAESAPAEAEAATADAAGLAPESQQEQITAPAPEAEAAAAAAASAAAAAAGDATAADAPVGMAFDA